MNDANVKAILLAAGKGTRLKPLTEVLPKCLMPIDGVPLLAYWLDSLERAGVSDILVNLHHHADVVERWLSATNPSIETRLEKELLGTAGTLRAHKQWVDGEPVMLVHADNLCFADLAAFIDSHENRPAGTVMTMMTFTTPTPRTCGIVETDENGVLEAFHEKVENPPGDHANAAVYIVEPEVAEFIVGIDTEFVDFSIDVIPHFLGRIHTWHNGIYHRDIGNLESLLLAQVELPDHETPKVGVEEWRRFCADSGEELIKLFLSALERGLGHRAVSWSEIQNSSIISGMNIADLTWSTSMTQPGEKSIEELLFLPTIVHKMSTRDFFVNQGRFAMAMCRAEKDA